MNQPQEPSPSIRWQLLFFLGLAGLYWAFFYNGINFSLQFIAIPIGIFLVLYLCFSRGPKGSILSDESWWWMWWGGDD